MCSVYQYFGALWQSLPFFWTEKQFCLSANLARWEVNINTEYTIKLQDLYFFDHKIFFFKNPWDQYVETHKRNITTKFETSSLFDFLKKYT